MIEPCLPSIASALSHKSINRFRVFRWYIMNQTYASSTCFRCAITRQFCSRIGQVDFYVLHKVCCWWTHISFCLESVFITLEIEPARSIMQTFWCNWRSLWSQAIMICFLVVVVFERYFGCDENGINNKGDVSRKKCNPNGVNELLNLIVYSYGCVCKP